MTVGDCVEGVDPPRLLVKVARLYHTRGLRQNEVAERLHISQTRVSRLLQQAEDLGVIRTIVVPPAGLNSELEEELESKFGLAACYVVDVMSETEDELALDLGEAMASIFSSSAIPSGVLGFTSWSRTLRAMVASLQPVRSQSRKVVEMLGDLGPPMLQHEAARSTQRLAALTHAEPVFLRAPGVSSSPQIRQALLEQDVYARQALELLNEIDLALVGIGSCDVIAPLQPGDNFFTQEQFDHAASLGAAGQICLRFIDADGDPVPTDLDDLLIGVSIDQLAAARHRWAAAGGPTKYAAIRAALRGGWLDTLVVDRRTAEHLAATEVSGTVGGRRDNPSRRPSGPMKTAAR